METSAKTGSNIEELFVAIAKNLQPLNFINDSKYNGLRLEDQNDLKKNKECCQHWTLYVKKYLYMF